MAHRANFRRLPFTHMLGIRELRLHDTDPRATAKLERNLAALQLGDFASCAARVLPRLRVALTS